MKNKIHILGASGSGTSTLGNELSLILPHINLDGDDYFWIEKFTLQREPKDRVQLLNKDLLKYKQWILSGAVCGWGDEFKSYFDLVIFIYTPKEIRLQRIKDREYQRYGEEIFHGGSKFEQSKAFLEWASLYDEAGLEVRSRALHEHWMFDLTCPILRIEGDYTVKERVNIVLDYLKQNDSFLN
ncbi:Adenylate kinase [Paenibacillus sp. yr247]|uniref:ATP-binding protein n=1 Tax=Paenibacillus sp. yr247 TaxID=1761880 RepID=UPI00088E7B75|nr:AAA family ATPase [Paenibacillus sp. yr247]SDP22634.1 Adenylate kinase [Paenibacillus sp. yr247]